MILFFLKNKIKIITKMSSVKKTSSQGFFYVINYENGNTIEFDNKKYLDFLLEYSRNVYYGNKKELVYGQKTTEKTPIILEFLFKFKKNKDFNINNICNDNFKTILCSKTLDFLKESIDIKHSRLNDLTLFMFETDNETEEWNNEKECKKGIRFFLPRCKINKTFLSDFRIGYLKFLNKNLPLESKDCESIKGNEKWERILKSNESYYPFYGSKRIDEPIFNLKGFMTHDNYDISEEYEKIKDTFNYKEHSKVEDFSNDNEEDIFKVKPEIVEDEEVIINEEENVDKDKYFFPLIFTMDYASRTYKLTNNFVKECKDEEIKSNTSYENEEVKILYVLLGMLNNFRFEKSSIFKEIGKILYFIFEDKDIEEGFKIWIDIKNKYFNNLIIEDIIDKKINEEDEKLFEYIQKNNLDKSDDLEECFYDVSNIDKEANHSKEKLFNLFESFRDSNFLTIRTIAYYARKDNLNKYKEWHEKFCGDEIKDMIKDLSDVSISKCFLKYYWLDLVYVKGDEFMIYDKNKHKFIEGDINKAIIKGQLYNDFLIFIENFINKNRNSLNRELIRNNEEDEEFAVKKEKIKSLDSFIISIKKNFTSLPTINRIYTTLCNTTTINDKVGYGYGNKIDISLIKDSNIYLTGVSNGVIAVDPELRKAEFREGKPEDFITFTSNVPYMKDYTINCDDMKYFFRYMAKAFLDNDIRKYVYKVCSSLLRRKNVEKKIYTFIGDTNGSKSIFGKILSKCLGSYSVTLGGEILTERQKAGSANPVLVQLRNTALGLISEADASAPQISCLLKLLSGGDEIQVRDLFKGATKRGMECCFRIFVFVNIIPSLTDHDRASKERNAIIPMQSEFVPNNDKKLPLTIEEKIEKKIFSQQEDVNNNIDKLARGLLWYMVYAYKTYSKEPLKQPEIIEEVIKDHWMKADHIIRFINDALEITNDENNHITEKECYSLYLEWFSMNSSSLDEKKDKCKLNDFIQKMKHSDKLGKCCKREVKGKNMNVWKGWKVNPDFLKSIETDI